MEGQGVYSPKEQYKQMFIEAVRKRPGSMVMWRVLDEIGFFNSPASANHHLNVPGGLLIHSLNVAKAAMELCEAERFAQCDKNAVLTCTMSARLESTLQSRREGIGTETPGCWGMVKNRSS